MMRAMSGIPAGAGQLLGKRLGKFDILALLALGGTAEIYLARIGGTAGFEKYVVVKCLHDHLADDAEFVKMFLDEARLAAHLDHSNIVQTMELGRHEGRYYMVMEFLAGLSLAMIVRRAAERMPDARIPAPIVLNILAQSCAGLHYAHEKAMNGKALNIVHRDISPQNLVISFEGVVKVVDFGIAKAEMRETRTRSGTIKGKFAYMSPEQCVANNVDRRTDVFALGVIAHELLTGRRLFKRQSPYETYQAVLECDVKPPSALQPGIDLALDPVIMRALTKDKADRYPTAEAFGDALLGYLHHRGISSGQGDVARYFEAVFGQELDEHSARMRELISGRDIAVEAGVSWSSGEIDDDGRRDDGAGKPGARAHDPGLVRESGDIEELLRPSVNAMTVVADDLGTGSRVEDDDEMPAERTRIESNPLERVNELERLVARAPAPAAKLPPSSAVPVPAAPSGPRPVSSPPGMPPSGQFPDLGNVPTVIAEPDPAIAREETIVSAAGRALADTGSSPALSAMANTQIAALPIIPAPGASSNGAPPQAARLRPYQPPRPYVSSSGPPVQQVPAPPVQQIPGPPVPQVPAPPGYPVMNAQLSAQIATGATVFPSDLPGGSPQPAPPVPSSASYPSSRAPELGPGSSAAPGPAAGYPHVPSPARVAESGPGRVVPGDGAPFDAQRAANLMSPVGQQYPEQVDWGAAAASRARAVPPWLLAILFIAALGVALALTIAIAKLIR
jgi:serine/threonine-protein kinase